MKTITVIEVNDITKYPPVQNLIKVLLFKGYNVNFIGKNIDKIADDIKEYNNYCSYEIGCNKKYDSIIKKAISRIYMSYKVNKYFYKCMFDSDYLWTTSMETIRIVGKKAVKYKNILQLMELIEHGYHFRHYFKFSLEKYARLSWKTVVPEINRAYIQKIWWDLPQLPYVLPNKPFNIDLGESTPKLNETIEVLKSEKRKIVLYLGGIYRDRKFDDYAKAINDMEDYVFYVVGKAFSDSGKQQIKNIVEKYNAVYLGSFDPPGHLAVVKYAYIGLLPYMPLKSKTQSCLNALYCAPNKIWEYAGFGVPMVGSDVLGLKLPFEQWNIGRCCDLDDENSIIRAIEEVDKNHDEMSKNCYKFYNSVDLDKIVSEILED